ncbi:MAG: hypothetical protein ACREJ3_01390 [Polyangiaceae bacterium]
MDLVIALGKIKTWSVRVGIGTLLVLVVGSVAYTFATLNFSYSKGTRVGFVQKLAKRGWICKTTEGELAMVNMSGQQAQMFDFTVRDEQVVKEIDALSGHRVALEYEEHEGIPTSCFGDTKYFVTAVRETK